jgi:hypothetical protein
MYPSLFGFKKLTDNPEIVSSVNNSMNNANSATVFTKCQNEVNQNIYNDYDTASVTNNVEEFKILFRTQEKACYELRTENTVLKMKLEVANETIRIQSKKIKSLKMKKINLKIEKNVYKNVLYNSSLSFNNNHQHSNFSNNNNNVVKSEELAISSHSYPPPPPPPLPLPPPLNKMKVNGNFQMNSVLDELKSKIKKID